MTSFSKQVIIRSVFWLKGHYLYQSLVRTSKSALFHHYQVIIRSVFQWKNQKVYKSRSLVRQSNFKERKMLLVICLNMKIEVNVIVKGFNILLLRPKTDEKGREVIIFYHMGHYQVSIFKRLGHYLGHYNYLAKVSIFILGCGYPA